jgi:serine/threonine-protein kinase
MLAGKYRVERIIGQGGMGVVVAAHHLQLDEKVALKFLLPEALQNAESVSRFLREARAAAKIKNEHVARVIDVGQLETGSPYIVMEYLEGGDLSGWLEERGPLPIELAVDFMLQTCEALANAHALGIVHRDLKPANLFCIQRTDGQLSIKVLDFGISKITAPGAEANDMTRTNSVMGSPMYMSPEQMALSKGVDARADIWALGVILFELLSGRLPFEAQAVTELAIKVANEPAPLLRTLRADAPEGVERVVATCLEKNRERRFKNVGELAVALGDYGPQDARLSVERVLGTLRKAGISGRYAAATVENRVPASSSPGRQGVALAQTEANWGVATRKKAGAGVVAGIAAAVICATVAGGFLLRGSSTPPVDAASASAAGASSSEPTPAVSLLPPATDSLPPSALSTDAPTPSQTETSPGSRPALPAWPHRGRSAPPTRNAPTPPSVPQPAPPSPGPKPNCNPPYVIDSNGFRQYKPECL